MHKIAQVRPDVIVLCYSQGDPETLARLSEYWLPAILKAGVHKNGWPYVPICVCGLKADEFTSDHLDQWRGVYDRVRDATRAYTSKLSVGADEELAPDLDASMGAHEVWQAAMTQLLLAFPVCTMRPHLEGIVLLHAPMGNAECDSARRSFRLGSRSRGRPDARSRGFVVHGMGHVTYSLFRRRLGMVIVQAMTLAMHPIFPIYDPHTNQVTQGFDTACKRIFRILDRDGDGLLSQDEMSLHQEYTFGVRVTHAEMDNVLLVGITAVVDASWILALPAAPYGMQAMKDSEGTQTSAVQLVDPVRGYLTFAGFQQTFLNFIMNVCFGKQRAVISIFTRRLCRGSLKLFGGRCTLSTIS
jgi:hypothetical protein